LERTENQLSSQNQSWYYLIPHSSNAALLAFYRADLPQHAWRCISSMTSTDIHQNGQPVTGVGAFVTAIRGGFYLQMNMGTQDYGNHLLGDMLLAHDGVALQISLEPTGEHHCS
jgi:hypothetical protein